MKLVAFCSLSVFTIAEYGKGDTPKTQRTMGTGRWNDIY